ncbi:MAG: T9SS type A sorting domain-containing protein [Bacteroidales bacterium]|nr:T9SS type A sorting domain-containing protein [Bacteroidales bacterium]
MKTITYVKGLISFIILFNALFFSNSVNSQTIYQLIFTGNYQNSSTVSYCPCDTIKCIPPTGETFNNLIVTGANYMFNGDTLVLNAGNAIDLRFVTSMGITHLRLRPQLPPNNPQFASSYTICGIESIVLDAENDLTGFQTDYVWSNAATTQTVSVGEGSYSVTVSNACGSIVASTTIDKFNVNEPDLGSDIVTCSGSSIVLNPGTGYSSTLWLPLNTTTNTLEVFESGTYIVEVTNDSDGCVDRDTVEINFITPPDLEICFVEYDVTASKNRIVWPTPPSSAQYINIYTEVSTNVWDLINTVPASETEFIDLSSNPQNVSKSYKIAVVDSCGNTGSESEHHKTITLLSVYNENSNNYGFTWSAYEGLSVANFDIYGLDSYNQSTLIGSVCGNTFFYIYTNPSPDFISFYVAFYTNSCLSKNEHLIKSNLVSSATTSLNEIIPSDLNIYPNPTNGVLHIDGRFDYVEVYDITGKLLFINHNDSSIDLSAFNKNIYYLRIINDNIVRNEKVILY